MQAGDWSTQQSGKAVLGLGLVLPDDWDERCFRWDPTLCLREPRFQLSLSRVATAANTPRSRTRDAAPEPSRVAPAVLGQSCWVWAHSSLLPNPRGSPQESGESQNPQPKRASTHSPVQPIPGTFSPRERDVSGVGSERRREHIPLRIPASPPRLQGFFPSPLFNYVQGSFTGFAITLIAFRDDISSAENAIRVPAMLCSGGKFIWMLLIPL